MSKIRILKWSIKFLHTPYIISCFYSFLTLYLNFFKIFHLYNFKIRISYTDPEKDTYSNFHQHLNLCLQLPGVSFFFTTHNSSTMIPFITIVALQHKKVLTSRSLRDTQFLNYMINNTRPSTPEKYEILEKKIINHVSMKLLGRIVGLLYAALLSVYNWSECSEIANVQGTRKTLTTW